MNEVILDVREKDEYHAEHIAGSTWIPLSHLNELAPAFLQTHLGKKIVIMCRSGKRAQLAQTQIAQLGFGNQISTEVFGGGILEWVKQGKPVITQKKYHLPIMRQVQLIAGSSVVAFVLLSQFLDPQFVWGAAFFGAGLAFTGVTGFCGMAQLLAIMPWNKTNSEGCSS